MDHTKAQLQEMALRLSDQVKDYVRMQPNVSRFTDIKGINKDAEHIYQSLSNDLNLSDEEYKILNSYFAKYVIFGIDRRKLKKEVQ